MTKSANYLYLSLILGLILGLSSSVLADNATIAQLISHAENLASEASLNGHLGKAQEAMDKANEAAALIQGAIGDATSETAQELLDMLVRIQDCHASVVSTAQAVSATATDTAVADSSDALAQNALASIAALNGMMQALIDMGAVLPPGVTMQAYQPSDGTTPPAGGVARPGAINPGGSTGGGTGGGAPASPIQP